MKICFLAPANSAHTKKWCDYFVSKGHTVEVVSFVDAQISGATVHFIDSGVSAEGRDKDKLKYLFKASAVRKCIKTIAPDVINVHYATSYGTVAALAGLKNYVLSVWGSDIYEFPNKSPLHRLLLKFSLYRAKYLFSTSKAMAEEASQYTNKQFDITPFGVDMELFSPEKRRLEHSNYVIGTVKGLAPAYGIDVLLKAAAIVRKEYPEIPLKVRIAGKGPCQDEYYALATELGVEEITAWLGFIPQDQAAEEWANMDVAVICSNAESFGVSAVEAQSCGCPVVITNVPGLIEATKPGETSIVVPRKNEQAVADVLVTLYRDETRRKEIGAAGRAYVAECYEYQACFEHIMNLLMIIAEKHASK